MIHFFALRHNIGLTFTSFRLVFTGHRRSLIKNWDTYILFNAYSTISMPPKSRRAKKNSKSKQGEKRLRSPSRSETEKGSDNSQIVTDSAIYFFRPKGEHGYLSQWYASSFTDGTYSYENAEQYMMHRKGMLFAPDSPVTSAILETTNPRDIKSLGRVIPNFDEAVWKRDRLHIVTEGSRLKFRQSEALKARLLATEGNELVEASPFDRIWGIGFGAKQAPMKRDKWGQNLLGKALMAVRQELREEATGDSVDSAPKLGPRRDSMGSQHSLKMVDTWEEQHPPVRNIRALPSPTQAKVILSLMLPPQRHTLLHLSSCSSVPSYSHIK
ncbi:unnamed protein product [Rhizoctonia solani]|uniref:NADAR domain-containing protein n=1 Tax=Rhizoctonia solani TaxID=456999 RepID=A0A8H3HCS7_9AGAM|nr:unnamed protein product [Rhizoctonia solani]